MKRPVLLIVGAAAGALIVAGAGASVRTVLSPTHLTSHTSVFGSEATGSRVETPEPSDTPEATQTPEPTDTPEPTASAEPDETLDTEANDEHDNGTATGGGVTLSTTTKQPKSGGDHEGSGGGESSGGGHGD